MRKYNPKDLIGQTHKRLTVKEIAVIDNQTYIICECTCGNTIKCFPYQFKNGSYSSCGCLKYDNLPQMWASHHKAHNRIDGRASEPLYGIWRQMNNRCSNPKAHGYSYYGGKGIKVCNEWQDYISFKEWAINNGYQKGLSIDRINPNKNYEPSNCGWVTKSQQQQSHKSSNRYLTYNGETLTIAEWSKKLNIPYRTINNRVNRGNYSIEQILNPNYTRRNK